MCLEGFPLLYLFCLKFLVQNKSKHRQLGNSNLSSLGIESKQEDRGNSNRTHDGTFLTAVMVETRPD